MKIIISNAVKVEFKTKIDLLQLIPDGIDGKVLNYGQGEGQVLIGESVWGIYYSSNTECVLQYEEGIIDFLTVLALATRIIEKLKREFGQDLIFRIKGLLEDYEPHEKYT